MLVGTQFQPYFLIFIILITQACLLIVQAIWHKETLWGTTTIAVSYHCSWVVY